MYLNRDLWLLQNLFQRAFSSFLKFPFKSQNISFCFPLFKYISSLSFANIFISNSRNWFSNRHTEKESEKKTSRCFWRNRLKIEQFQRNWAPPTWFRKLFDSDRTVYLLMDVLQPENSTNEKNITFFNVQYSKKINQHLWSQLICQNVNKQRKQTIDNVNKSRRLPNFATTK